jgi:hypothetical protein
MERREGGGRIGAELSSLVGLSPLRLSAPRDSSSGHL